MSTSLFYTISYSTIVHRGIMLPDALFYIHDLLMICYYALRPEPNAGGADGRIRWRPAVRRHPARSPHVPLRALPGDGPGRLRLGLLDDLELLQPHMRWGSETARAGNHGRAQIRGEALRGSRLRGAKALWARELPPGRRGLRVGHLVSLLCSELSSWPSSLRKSSCYQK